MTIETTREIVDAILQNDKDRFNSAFENAISTKVTDALEVKKVEIASSLLGTPEPEEVAVEATPETTETNEV